mgnify:CR=1 FL=1
MNYLGDIDLVRVCVCVCVYVCVFVVFPRTHVVSQEKQAAEQSQGLYVSVILFTCCSGFICIVGVGVCCCVLLCVVLNSTECCCVVGILQRIMQ